MLPCTSFSVDFYFHSNILLWHVLAVISVVSGKCLEMFRIRNKSLLPRKAALKQGTSIIGWLFPLCSYRMTLNYLWLSFSTGEKVMQCQFLSWASLLPTIARGKTRGFLRKEGAAIFNYDTESVLFVWLMSPHFKRSPLMYLSLLTTLPFMCCWLFLRFMRPNSQVMCVWIKGTWESLFMSDPRKFPLSCLSEVHAESMMGRRSPQCPGRVWNLLSFLLNWTENKLTDPQVYP